MESRSIINSENSEKRWVLQVDTNFSDDQQIINIDFDYVPTSVFRVPKTLTEAKPEAYVPQRLGLGPYHHFRSDLYLMQKKKFAAVRRFLSNKQSGQKTTFQEVVECLVQCEPILRACYDEYLDFNIQTLARVIAIDALYLLQFLECYNQQAEHPEIKELESDIFMLENQIPVILLQKIIHVLDYENFSLWNQFQGILFDHSPLKLSKQREIIEDEKQFHILNRLYHLIVNNTDTGYALGYSRMGISYAADISWTEVDSVIGFMGNQGLPGAVVAGQIVSFVENVPWAKILELFKKDNDENLIIAEEIDIPTVSEMTEKAGIKFKLTLEGIRAIEYREEGQGKYFYLPVIYVKPDSEMILRNLVVFESVLAKPGSTGEFAQYVDLMCGIIDTKKDVDILRKARIIESELDDEEIVGIFNGIGKTTVENETAESKIEQAIDAGKKQYDNVFSVRAKRFVSSYGPWLFKSVKLVVYVLILVMLTLQAYCSVFGCSRWFGASSTLQGGYNLLHSVV